MFFLALCCLWTIVPFGIGLLSIALAPALTWDDAAELDQVTAAEVGSWEALLEQVDPPARVFPSYHPPTVANACDVGAYAFAVFTVSGSQVAL